MAARWEDKLQGYDVSRFRGEVKVDSLCVICQEVPKDPRLCQHKDHIFCFAHISQHLAQNSETCPVCRDPLNQETLRRPTGFLKNYLDDLEIKCDHHDRGCPDHVRLEELPRHVEECVYAPVMCRNEGCGTEVNKRDIKAHENDLCQFRIAKCHDCKNIMKNVNAMKGNQDEMKRKQDAIKEIVDEFKAGQDETNVQMSAMKIDQDEMKESMKEIKKQLKRLMAMMMNQPSQGVIINDPGPVNNQDIIIIIIGGRCGDGSDQVLDTLEKYNIAEGKSTQLPRLSHARASSASCVYNNDVLVVGGYVSKEGSDEIEVLKINQHPLQWTMFDGKLPIRLSGHDVIVYQGNLYIVGGLNWNERIPSDAIYEIALTPPYTVKLLTRMAEPKIDHKAELIDGKLFILGGSTTGYSENALDSVVVYDFIKNEFKPCPPLPQPVCYMSTVTWGKIVIVVGGADRDNRALNDVIKYDTETGQSERLPSMIHKRSRCSAVLMDDVIVVFGGWNRKQGYLNSVESYTMGGNSWKELPGMIEKRRHATAIVKPL
ncbi:kelch domain-containing protein 8A-like [Dendronephthya gigantea]|uniref:kelch domain-containing protein 8A-like n=1 Tax=Dendronephthya gigantea TaxID=151771 RepID=UPI001069A95A|nr:kelch domain-containing protein 8A-like [Dendronephthya gigantea]